MAQCLPKLAYLSMVFILIEMVLFGWRITNIDKSANIGKNRASDLRLNSCDKVWSNKYTGLSVVVISDVFVAQDDFLNVEDNIWHHHHPDYIISILPLIIPRISPHHPSLFFVSNKTLVFIVSLVFVLFLLILHARMRTCNSASFLFVR